MNLIYYKIKIVRPIGKDNPSTYETIFEGYGTMDTNARDPAYIEDCLSSSVLY
ncbi:hypothetical protein [Commensalibacter oyaizuii]|uniref:Uncharacterized protein n=1 Tax=Commensalibacter oyaizuii TaxID=3043873 RepID=A0ABT6PZ88_9PROT|nr:hypothetical protein [Commensalibacter sp. TBRC 16381]MDI2090166.1 hypothetical protein [Commensalibacter sp. TBRC 16381]